MAVSTADIERLLARSRTTCDRTKANILRARQLLISSGQLVLSASTLRYENRLIRRRSRRP